MISPSLEIRLKDLSFAIPPVAVFILGDFIFDLLSNWNIVVPLDLSGIKAIDEATIRYSFLSAEFAFMILSIGVFAYFWYDISRSFRPNSRNILVGLYVVLCGIMACYIWKPTFDVLPKRTYYVLGKDFFEVALKSVKYSQLGSINLYDVYNIIIKIMNVCAFIAVPALVVGCVSTLGRCRPALKRTGEGLEGHPSEPKGITDSQDYDNVLALGYQADRLKVYLFLSSVLLISVVIQLIYWMQLPSFALKDPTRAEFGSLVRSISTYYGVSYTLLLCSYYIPPSIILVRRIHNTAKTHLVQEREPLTAKNIRRWESRMGLQVLDLKSYKIIAALLSPLLPGLIGGALGAFGGGK